MDERACVSMESGVREQPIPIPSPYTSFSRKLDLVPSYPMSLASFLISPPLEEPLVPQVPHLMTFEDDGGISNQKYFVGRSMLSSFSLISLPFSYILVFPFSPSSWHTSSQFHRCALSLLHAFILSCAYLISYEMCSSAFDKLLRALNYYFLERSSLDPKQAFLGK